MRERLLHSALECFSAFGFHGTSTRAVAEHAQTSHTLLLYHFESKEQLWRSTMGEAVQLLQQAFAQRLDEVDADDPTAQLRAFVEAFVAFSARVPQVHRVMTQQSTQGSDRVDWLVEHYLRQTFETVCDIIRRGQAAGRVRGDDPQRLYYAIIALGGTPTSVAREFQLLTGRDLFADAEVRHTVRAVFDYVFV